jgi:hypothetical protein
MCSLQRQIHAQDSRHEKALPELQRKILHVLEPAFGPSAPFLESAPPEGRASIGLMDTFIDKDCPISFYLSEFFSEKWNFQMDEARNGMI